MRVDTVSAMLARQSARIGGWPLDSVAARRRARLFRLAAYRAFGRDQSWSVLGLHQDLSLRYPVAPLIGALSAQAELALSGEWEGRPAVLASALVAPPRSSGRTARDVVVQLTILDTGPPTPQYTSTARRDGADVVALTRGPEPAAEIESLLRMAADRGDLLPGDQVAAGEVELMHTRVLQGRRPSIDLHGPLRVLASLADATP